MIKKHFYIALCILFMQTMLNASNIIYNKTDGKIIVNVIYDNPTLSCKEFLETLQIDKKSQASFIPMQGPCKIFKIIIQSVDGSTAGLRLYQNIPLLDPNLCIYIANKGGTLTATQVSQ